MTRGSSSRWIPWLLGCLGFLWFLAVHRYGVNVLDEGYLLGPVQRILAGEVPYRDFVHQYAPGRFYVVAALFSIFPTTVETTRLLWVALLSGSVAGTYVVARRIAGPAWALWPALCLLAAPGPWQKSPLIAATVASLWVLGKFVERPGTRTALLVGVVAGVVCLVRQDVGLYALVVFAVVAAAECGVRSAWRGGLACGLGFSLVLLPASALLFVAGAAGDALHQVLFAGLDGLRANALPFPSLFPVLPRDLSDLVEIPGRWLHYVPLVVYGLSVPAVIGGLRRGDRRCVHALAVLGMGALLFRLNLDRSHMLHLVQVIGPAWILLSWHGHRRSMVRTWGLGQWVAAGSMGLVLLVMQAKLDHFHYPNSVLVAMGDHETMDLSRARMHVEPMRRRALEGVVNEIQRDTKAGDPVLALPDLPLLHFLADRPNPIGFDLLRPGRLRDRNDEERLLAQIDARAVETMVWNARPVDGERLDRRLQNHAPVFWGGLRARFEATGEHGPYRVFQRREDIPRPPVLLAVVDTLAFDHVPPVDIAPFVRFVQGVTPSLDATRAMDAFLSGRIPGNGGSVGIHGGLADGLMGAGYRWSAFDGDPAEIERILDQQDLEAEDAPVAVLLDLRGSGNSVDELARLLPQTREWLLVLAGLTGPVEPEPAEPPVPTTRGPIPGLRTVAAVERRASGSPIPRDDRLRVGIWLRLPGGEGAGLVHGAPVSLIDVAPTVLDYLAVPTPFPVDGVSLLPLVRGMKPLRTYRYVESGDGWWGLRSPREKWLRGPNGETILVDLLRDPEETMDRSPRSRTRTTMLETWATARRSPSAEN